MPVRSFVVSRLFSPEDLHYLDPSGESEEEYHDEQREYLHHHEGNLDDADAFHGFSEFRTKGVNHDAADLRKRQAVPVAAGE